MNVFPKRALPCRARLTVFVAAAAALLFSALSLTVGTAQAQTTTPTPTPTSSGGYPNRAVKLVVPFPPGGATDLSARLLAGKLADIWGQPVVVENRPGASGMIGTDQVAKGPADGYTILVTIPTHVQNSAVFAKLPYDPFADFEPITQIALSYLVLAVPAESPVRSLQEFVTTTKAAGGKAVFGSFGSASSSHLMGERFNRVAGLQMTHVPYKGSGPLVTDLLGGQVGSAWIDISTATPHLAAGKLRGLAVTGPKRAPMQPNLPTLKELGYSGFEPLGWAAVLVPAGVPKPVIAIIARDMIRVIKMPDVQTRLNEQTLVPVGNTPEEFSRVLKEDAAQWKAIARDAGIEPQ